MYDRKIMLRLFWTIVVIFSMMIMTLMLEGCTEPKKQKEVKVYNIDTLNITSVYIC